MLELHPLQPGQHENWQVRGGGVSPWGPQATATPFLRSHRLLCVVGICTEKEVYEKLKGWRRRGEDPCPELGYSGVRGMELESPGGSWPHNHVGQEALAPLAGVTHMKGTAT